MHLDQHVIASIWLYPIVAAAISAVPLHYAVPKSTVLNGMDSGSDRIAGFLRGYIPQRFESGSVDVQSEPDCGTLCHVDGANEGNDSYTSAAS